MKKSMIPASDVVLISRARIGGERWAFGDTATLQSGGPIMLVVDFPEPEKLQVAWIENGVEREASLDWRCLRRPTGGARASSPSA